MVEVPPLLTQYNTDEWYERINPTTDDHIPISEAIMGRIVHNTYEVLIDGKVSFPVGTARFKK